MKYLYCVLLVLLTGVPARGNVVFNPGFEMGTDGFIINRFLTPALNPKLEYHPLEIDGNSAPEGKKQLKIANPYGEKFELHSKGFALKQNTPYRFSVLAKGPAKAKIQVMIYGINELNGNWQTVFSKRFDLSDTYREYQGTFNIGNRIGQVWHILIMPVDKIHKHPIWLDELTVKPADTPSSGKLEGTVVSERLTEMENKTITLTLKLHNNTASAIKKNITVRGVDEVFKKEVFRKNIPVELAPGEAGNYTFERKLSRYGAITLYADDVDKLLPGYYLVIGKYNARPIDLMKEFCVGINGGLNYIWSEKPAYRTLNAPLEKYPEMYSRIGCRLVRGHDCGIASTQWVALEPQEGKWDFSHLDLATSLFGKYKIELLPVLGRVEFVIPQKNVKLNANQPQWLAEKSPFQKPDLGGWSRNRVIHPPAENWRQYVRTVAERLKGKIQVYEIINEPNLVLWPKPYVKYLNIAIEEIRKADPAAKIAGFGLTSDFGTDASKWLKAAKGIEFPAIDIAGFHPYDSRTLGSVNAADDDIARIRKRYPANMQLWNTEVYYLYDFGFSNIYLQQAKVKPYHGAWRFLTDLAEGVGQSTAAHHSLLFKSVLIPGFHCNPPLDMIPSENAGALNMLARHLEGGKCIFKKKFDSGLILYAFRKRDNTLMAALWNFREQQGLQMDLAGLQIKDLFGNPVKAGILPVTPYPLYLFPGTLSENAFMEKLKQLNVIFDRPVQAVPFLRIFSGNGKSTGMLYLTNISKVQQKGIAGVSGGVKSTGMLRFDLAPGETAALEFPVTVTDRKKPVELRLGAGKRIHRFELKPLFTAAARSGDKLSLGNGECRVSRKNGNIVISGRINDATDAGVTGKRYPWDTDSAELFIDAAPEKLGKKPETYTPQTTRFFITPRDPAGKQLTVWSKHIKAADCRLQIRCTTKGWSFDLSFPDTGFAPDKMGFDIVINDSGKKRVGAWSEFKESFCNRLGFGLIRFK